MNSKDNVLYRCLVLVRSQLFNVNLKQAAWFSALPWGTMAVSGYFAGSASDFLIRTGHSVTSVRKIMQVIIKSAILG